jgi:N-acetylmuramoyl-L-alanine amidase
MATELEVRRDHLPYISRLDQRLPGCIDLVVIHCTELPDLLAARSYGERILYPGSGTGNSGHYYLERNGAVEEWAPIDRIAHHAGQYNERSIGIELVNLGRYPDWYDSRRQTLSEPYPDDQIEALIRLLLELRSRLPRLQFIAGHDQLDTTEVVASDDPARRVRRKRDTGPLFPWSRVLKAVALAPWTEVAMDTDC